MKERPTGIVLLVILEFISGILNLGITARAHDLSGFTTPPPPNTAHSSKI
jgi:hypothetical protein